MIILASGSPRRKQLLQRLGVPFETVASAIVERAPAIGEYPAKYAVALAVEKASDVHGRYPGRIVLGADTVVALNGEIFGKPEDPDDALRMLRCLRGRWHTVVTGVAVRSKTICRGWEAAQVLVRNAPDEELEAYVATGEPMDKAGAYAVQGIGGSLVERVTGCYETVVGLPLCVCSRVLEDCGVSLPSDHHCLHLS